MNHIVLFGGNFSQKVIKPCLLNLKNNLIKYEVTTSNLTKNKHRSNYYDFLLDTELDSAIIAVPPSENLTILDYLIKHSRIKKIFMEKPLSDTYENAKKIYDLALNNNINLFIDYSFIFFDPFIYLQKLINEERIVSYSIKWDSKTKQNFKVITNSWKNKSTNGGGGLMNFGSHIISLILNFFGDINSIKSKLFNLSDPFILDEYMGNFTFYHNDITGKFIFNVYSENIPCFIFNIQTTNHFYELSTYEKDYFNGYNLYEDGNLVYSFKKNFGDIDSRTPIISKALSYFFDNNDDTCLDNALKTQFIIDRIRIENGKD